MGMHGLTFHVGADDSPSIERERGSRPPSASSDSVDLGIERLSWRDGDARAHLPCRRRRLTFHVGVRDGARETAG
jgi:hypothetical protein